LHETGIKAAAIHGNKSQGARTKALESFKAGEIQALVATDIAARGLDIDQLPHVVNFDLPSVPEDYVHRIGRTGRAGATGQAISLVSADEFKQLVDIERLTGKCLKREYLDEFYPTHEIPDSSNIRHRHAKNQVNKPRNQTGGNDNTKRKNTRNKPNPNRNAGNPDSRRRRKNPRKKTEQR